MGLAIEERQLALSEIREKSPSLRLFISVTVTAGIALTAAGLAQATGDNVIMLLALVVAAAGAEFFAIELFVDSHVSVSSAALMAAGAIFGIWGVALTAPAIAIAGHVRLHSEMQKTAFNFGAFSIAGAAYVAVFRLFHGNIADTGLREALPPATAAGLGNMAVNSLLVAAAIALDQHRSIARVWRGNFLWLVPQYAALAVLALGVALALTNFGTWSLLLFALPMVSLSEALHTRADAMRMRNRATEMIADVHRRAA